MEDRCDSGLPILWRDVMNEKEFIDMVIEERIGQLLQKERDGGEDAVEDKAEEILQELEEGKRMQLEEYMNRLIDMAAQHERYLYMEGFRDGVRLMLRVSEIGRSVEMGKGGTENL